MGKRQRKKLTDYAVTLLRYSCITHKAVWLYCGASKNAAYVKYHRACRMEKERIRQWPEYAALRKANILRMLADCTASFSSISSSSKPAFTPQQLKAARTLRAIAEEPFVPDYDFYNHIIEERKQRENDRRIRMEMRIREAKEKEKAKEKV